MSRELCIRASSLYRSLSGTGCFRGTSFINKWVLQKGILVDVSSARAAYDMLAVFLVPPTSSEGGAIGTEPFSACFVSNRSD